MTSIVERMTSCRLKYLTHCVGNNLPCFIPVKAL